MKFKVKLSVNEILQNKHFKHAKVIAGNSGLNRYVRWVHVLESSSIENLLNGNELILSPGISWEGNKEVFCSIVQQAIDSNAAGLCIVLGSYVTEIPQEVIELAETHSFPIIAFFKEMRFIDITQEIQSLLIQKNYQILFDLEEYSKRLNQLLLSSNPQQRILQLLHNHINMSVFYISNQGKVQVISKKTPTEQDHLLQLLKDNNISKQNIAHQSVQAMNQTFADLFIISESETITEFESLILDRSAIALAQSHLRELLYIEEQKKAKEAEWVGSWIEGRHSNEQIQRYLSELEPNLKPNGCTVLLCKVDNLEEVIPEITYFIAYLRSVFEQRGFSLLSHIQKNQIVFILLNKWKTGDLKRRVQEGIERLKKSQYIKNRDLSKIKFGVGKFSNQLSHIKNSYHTAKETIKFQEKMSNELNSYFYEDLYIFRLVLAANEQGILSEFISDYLGPVLIHDQEKNGELLKTLKIYLQCKGAKKETAEKLHIVRQTLYHRLNRLYKLIGSDFMEPYKRQAIEVAISAYEYATSTVTPYEYLAIPKTS